MGLLFPYFIISETYCLASNVQEQPKITRMTSQKLLGLVKAPLRTTEDDSKLILVVQNNLTVKGKASLLMIVQLCHLYFVICRNDKQMKCYLRLELQAADVKLSHGCISEASWFEN